MDKNDTVAFKDLSQQKIQNACYKICYGMHNSMGVHGACPMEMLHQILLGVFKYTREEFFNICGENHLYLVQSTV